MDRSEQQEMLKKISPQAPLMKDRLTKTDKDSIKAFFKDEWITLTIVRDLFFGFPLNEFEKSAITGFTPALKKTLRKIFLPELTKENPIGSSVDLWMTVQIMDKPENQQVQTFSARKILIDMQEKALALLDNSDGEKVRLDIKDSDDIPYLIARNTFVSHIDQQLILLNTLAYQTEETEEEKAKRLRKDSVR